VYKDSVKALASVSNYLVINTRSLNGYHFHRQLTLEQTKVFLFLSHQPFLSSPIEPAPWALYMMIYRLSLFALSALPLAWGMALHPREDIDDPLNPPENPSPLPPGPIFGRAPELDKRFQPALDFDTDSCYNVPALGPNGDLSMGQFPYQWPPQKDCRREEMLERSNVYSRQRCNSGYCVIMYAYYFQKDTATPMDGHRHDWEHIAVWVRMSDKYVTHVSVSQHKGYDIRENPKIEWTSKGDGKPAVVYHKDGPSTHCFRFASGKDFGNGGPENHWRKWITGPLIGYHGWESAGQRDRMLTHSWGAAAVAIKNENFAENIRKARPNGLAFDENKDDDGTNNI
jgi:hypothetical protein